MRTVICIRSAQDVLRLLETAVKEIDHLLLIRRGDDGLAVLLDRLVLDDRPVSLDPCDLKTDGADPRLSARHLLVDQFILKSDIRVSVDLLVGLIQDLPLDIAICVGIRYLHHFAKLIKGNHKDTAVEGFLVL